MNLERRDIHFEGLGEKGQNYGALPGGFGIWKAGTFIFRDRGEGTFFSVIWGANTKFRGLWIRNLRQNEDLGRKVVFPSGRRELSQPSLVGSEL